MPSGEIVDPPYSLKSTQECYIDQVLILILIHTQKNLFVIISLWL